MRIFTFSCFFSINPISKLALIPIGAVIFLCTMVNCVQAQNAIVGTGFSSGWGNACVTGDNYTYFGFDAGTSLSSSLLTPNGTGNQYWRMAVGWGGVFKQLNLNNTATDTVVLPNKTYRLNSACVSNGAMFTNVSSINNRYIFKTKNAGENPTGDFVMFVLSGMPITVDAVSQSPAADNVIAGQAVTVTATASGAVPVGQGVWLRYTTDNFVTSSSVQLTGSGTTYNGTIPETANTSGTSLIYYIYTSGTPATIAHADVPFYTINGNYNGGANYSYTVKATLPISLISFSGHLTSLGNSLNWSTASEVNSAGFELQSSVNGTKFSIVAFVATKAKDGVSNEKLTYDYSDKVSFTASRYYRLRQIDKDGKYSFSRIVLIKAIKALSVTISAIYPNPAINSLQLVITSPSDRKISLVITDMKGRVVMETNAEFTTGTNSFSLNVSALSKGIYTLNVVQPKERNSSMVKFIKL